jgi:hypothetical protein
VHGEGLVEGTVGEGERVTVGHLEPDAPGRDVVSVASGGHAQHLLGDVHPGNEAVRRSLGGELDRAAVSKAHLEYSVGWGEAQQLKGVLVCGLGFGRHDAADQAADQPRRAARLPSDEFRAAHMIHPASFRCRRTAGGTKSR